MTENLLDTYNKIANDFYEDHKNSDWQWVRAKLFATYFPVGAQILDVGCGPGIKSKVLLESGMQVHGIDFSENMITLARQNCPQGTFEVCDVRNIAQVQSLFDGVFAFAVLLHFPKTEARKIVTDMVQKLKPGGYIFLAVKARREGGPEEEVKTESDYGYDYQRFFSYYTLEEIIDYLKAAGTSIVYQEAYAPEFRPGRDWHLVIGHKAISL